MTRSLVWVLAVCGWLLGCDEGEGVDGAEGGEAGAGRLFPEAGSPGVRRDGGPRQDLGAGGDADAAEPARDATRPVVDGGEPVADLGTWDSGAEDLGPQPDAAEPGPPGVAVRHARELRGVWIATVYNINFPSRAGLTADAQRAELRRLLDAAADVGLNAVFFQVRAEGDAFYRSALDPWSRFLTGTQGVDPGYDPLEVLVEEAHARNLEVHAWFNPYRAAVDAGRALSEGHPGRRFAQNTYVYGTQRWMDPGASEVIAHTRAVVLDVAERYAVDGVHFDDYFYPYPVDGQRFPDEATYAAYQAGGGALGLADWRRENVNTLIRTIAEALAARAPWVRFGIAPFGIYRPGTPPGIVGLDQFATLYADPPRWLEEGWVDYLAPQLYWNASRPQQDYETLLRWWCGLSQGGRLIFAGTYLSQLGSDGNWTVDEFRRQIGISRALAADGSQGNIHFQIAPLLNDRAGIAGVFRDELYARPALTPPMAGHAEDRVAPPRLAVDGETLRLEHPDAASLRAFAVYAPDGEGGWALERVLPASTRSLPRPDGPRAVAAVSRYGAESVGALVE